MELYSTTCTKIKNKTLSYQEKDVQVDSIYVIVFTLMQ